MEQQSLKHYFFATLSSVYPVTRQIKCCLQYTAVLNMAGYISSTSHVTKGKIIQKDAYITEDLGICCRNNTRKYSKWKIQGFKAWIPNFLHIFQACGLLEQYEYLLDQTLKYDDITGVWFGT